VTCRGYCGAQLDLACEPCGWKAANQQGSARPDLPSGRRRLNVGSTTHPRGAAQVGIRLSERTVSRRVMRANHDPDLARRWLAPVIAIAGDVERSLIDTRALEELNPYKFCGMCDWDNHRPSMNRRIVSLMGTILDLSSSEA
jgi:hypothetical protein